MVSPKTIPVQGYSPSSAVRNMWKGLSGGKPHVSAGIDLMFNILQIYLFIYIYSTHLCNISDHLLPVAVLLVNIHPYSARK